MLGIIGFPPPYQTETRILTMGGYASPQLDSFPGFGTREKPVPVFGVSRFWNRSNFRLK